MINDLEADGYIDKIKIGRRNQYRIHRDLPLKDEGSDAAVGELLLVLGAKRKGSYPRGGAAP